MKVNTHATLKDSTIGLWWMIELTLRLELIGCLHLEFVLLLTLSSIQIFV